MNAKIEQEAAEIILDRRKRLPMPAPFFLRWFGKKEIGFWVKANRAGTGYRISRYYAQLGVTQEVLEKLTVDEALKLHAAKGFLVSKMLACAILNGYFSGWLFTKLLAFYIRENSDYMYQLGLVNWLLLHGELSYFISTIRSVSKLRVTMPILSPTVKGS